MGLWLLTLGLAETERARRQLGATGARALRGRSGAQARGFPLLEWRGERVVGRLEEELQGRAEVSPLSPSLPPAARRPRQPQPEVLLLHGRQEELGGRPPLPPHRGPGVRVPLVAQEEVRGPKVAGVDHVEVVYPAEEGPERPRPVAPPPGSPVPGQPPLVAEEPPAGVAGTRAPTAER